MSAIPIPSIHRFLTRKPAGVASVALREIRPDDAAALQAFVRALSPAARRLRFHAALNELTESALQALTDVDQRAHVAFVLTTTERGAERIVGEARYIVSGDKETAEFGIAVADGFRGLGLARTAGGRTAPRGSRCWIALAHRRGTGRQRAHACLRAPLRLCRNYAWRSRARGGSRRALRRPPVRRCEGRWIPDGSSAPHGLPSAGYIPPVAARVHVGFPAVLITHPMHLAASPPGSARHRASG